MYSEPVPGPLALIHQSQRQTHVVESFQNTKFCKLAVTYVPRLDYSRKCLTPVRNVEIFIKVYLSSSLAPYLCSLILHLVLIQFSYLAKALEILYELSICTPHQWLHWFSLVRHIFDFGDFYLFLLCAFVFYRHYCTGHITNVCPFISMNYLFYVCTKGTFMTDLYQLSLVSI